EIFTPSVICVIIWMMFIVATNTYAKILIMSLKFANLINFNDLLNAKFKITISKWPLISRFVYGKWYIIFDSRSFER
ncbi:MAG: hypothetical protein K0S24_3930, partial [Sphingobacterium sp.]|nr:hypothetical protein [Sphingobacterium sp.]